MIVDGKQLADEIRHELKREVEKCTKKLRLAVISVGATKATEQFVAQKKKFGESVGIDVRVYKFLEATTTNTLRKKISEIVHIEKNTAVIIQLPLPPRIKTDYILDSVPLPKDADSLSSKAMGLFAAGRSSIIPPVAGAVAHILQKNNIDTKGKSVAVIGAGRLVGRPVTLWFLNQGATVSVCDENTPDTKRYTIDADIIVSGVGNANLITSGMVKDGVVAIDAGASESHGRIVGDMDPMIAEKASLFTPVPGGVGPLTIAMLFQNVVALGKK
jgi:methylenetetrahydrofolate dehydrogenase (NADP+)/methenyltetrahydrofolate cyclohydrolase